MDSLLKDEYERKYNAIVNPINAGGNAFYNSAERIAETLPKVIALSKELKLVGDRYAFYTMLVSAQKKEAEIAQKLPIVAAQSFGGINGGSTSYKSFGISTAVTADLAEGKYNSEEYKAGEKLFITNTWNPSYDAGTDKRFSWFQITATNPNDSGRKVNNP